MLRLILMLVLLIILTLAVCYLVAALFSGGKQRRLKKEIKQAQNTDREQWAAFPRVQSLLSSYIDIVTKLGPGSEAAEKFRFNAEGDPLLNDEKQAALLIFRRQADLIDETYRKLV